jgi:DNA-binding winged helix-turn-helix (wHTH) protein
MVSEGFTMRDGAPHESAIIRFGVLGPLEMARGGEPIHLGSPKQRAVLGILLTNLNRVVSTDRLIDEIWGDDAAPERQNALWVHISNLRKALEPENETRSDDGPLQTRSPGYALDVESHEVDSHVFESLLAEGRALTETDPAAASIVFAEALALWRGPAYADFVYEPWAQAEISRLEELRLEGLAQIGDVHPERVLPLGSRIITPDLVDQSIGRDHLVRVGQQDPHNGALLRRTEVDRAISSGPSTPNRMIADSCGAPSRMVNPSLTIVRSRT